MRVLWVINMEPSIYNRLKNKEFTNGLGSWINTLSETIITELDELHIVWQDSRRISENVNNVYFHTVPPDGSTRRRTKKLAYLINQINPNLVHIFGTEKYFGLVTPLVSAPVLIRLQGIKFIYKNYIYRGIPISKLSTSLIKVYVSMLLWSRNEKHILRHAKFIEGQTDWDKNILRMYNMTAKYYRNYPILRESFYKNNKVDQTRQKRFRIVAISSRMSYKGIHDLITSLKFFDCYKIDLILVGNRPLGKYGQYIDNLISQLPNTVRVNYVGYQSEEGLSRIMCESDVFVNPSYIENESLAMLEAYELGISVVCADSGGMKNIAKELGLNTIHFFPARDSYGLYRILSDVRSGEKESNKTKNYPGNKILTSRMIKIYKDVISY